MNVPQESRLKYEKPVNYSDDVLVGNWVEEKFGTYKKNQYNHVTQYKNDYIAKQAKDKLADDDTRNDIQIKSQYCDNISPPRRTDDVSNNYFDNFTTTYDLAFGYFPGWIRGTLNRSLRFRLLRYEPTDEYLNGYGNLSSRNGLTEDKKTKWDCDILDPRRPVTSIAKSDFALYDNEAYKTSKWPRLHPVTVKCGLATDTVYKPLPPNHPRTLESRRNPITWEGPDEDMTPKACVCKV